jgi:hypothetical protein
MASFHLLHSASLKQRRFTHGDLATLVNCFLIACRNLGTGKLASLSWFEQVSQFRLLSTGSTQSYRLKFPKHSSTENPPNQRVLHDRPRNKPDFLKYLFSKILKLQLKNDDKSITACRYKFEY